MNYEVMTMRGWGKTMAVIVALVLISIVYTQWAQARRLGLVKTVHSNKGEDAAAITLMPVTTDGSDGTVSVTHTGSQSGDGQVNDSNTDVSVSDNGDSISVTNTNHQEARSGDAEPDSGSVSSGSHTNTSSSSTTITKNGKVIYQSGN